MYVDVYEMINQKQEQKERIKDRYVFSCDNCGSGIHLYVEIWEEGADGPYHMLFLNQNRGCAEVVDEIQISEYDEKKDNHHYHFCGFCDSLVSLPITVEHDQLINQYIEKTILNQNPIN